MEKQTFNIPNISCGHCTMAIENELKEIDGISDVQSDNHHKERARNRPYSEFYAPLQPCRAGGGGNGRRAS